jgi:toxin YoeB
MRASPVRSVVFEGDTWERYEALRAKDKQLHKNLCRLIKEMRRGDPSAGIGKPEPLKHGLSGLWSRRLSQRDRLIYRFDDEAIYIFAIGGHYDDR